MHGEECPECNGEGVVKLFTSVEKCKRCKGFGGVVVGSPSPVTEEIKERVCRQRKAEFERRLKNFVGIKGDIQIDGFYVGKGEITLKYHDIT